MTTMHKKSTLVAALLGAMLSAPAMADTTLFSDDFEAYASSIPPGSYIAISAGSSALTGWTISGSSIDVIRCCGNINNSVSIDLAGSPGPGTLSRDFTAVAGQTYTLTFDLFANGPGTPLAVSFGGMTTTYPVALAPTTQSLAWTAAASGLQTLSFNSSSGYQGPTLDNISLTTAAVPEPGSYAMLLAGLVSVGFVAARRRSN